MSDLPLIAFDINETFLDLETLAPTFERIFGNKSAMRLLYSATPDEGKTVADVCYRTKPKLAPLLMEQSWSQLMAAAQEGDRAAYERLLRKILPFIRAIARRRQATEDRVDDVVQEVLLSVHRVRHTYDPARPFEAWLAAIADRRSIDVLRRCTRRAAVEIADPEAYENVPDPGANREGGILARDALKHAIADLPARQREALELLKLRELSLREAARVSGRSISALKVNIHRALKTLRVRFAQ
jgi:RNA polymerase sigma-70 factor (ECF subfamily)